ncbi:ABC transporter ATP-binding protein [Nitratireductor mangrovi]|uniref:ABC transporter ATP-binding protein n=1 Tax=Nitratireductor mangrovi TaxID=2599600 RepID=A0A5B8L0S6_9HYPH|nr:ABC transporter ATP-binding protein [Nitratireductor mangrovi]QDZ01312.1 ABC transporter ATP-binding protein [Nitratireductor mangrovi]
MITLRAHNIGVRFGGVLALHDVSLEIRPGEIVGLIGANGAGKSTLINVMSGFQRPTAGDVFLGDRALLKLPPHSVARAGVVRTFQGVRLFGELTIAENVAAVAAVVGSPAFAIEELVVAVGLTGDFDRKAATLSYSDQRKLAIARALALEPAFLLLDEPAAGMSPQEAEQLGVALEELVEGRGIGLLLVEHNMDLVMSVCQRLVALDVGRVIASGTPAAVRADPSVRAAYLGGVPHGAA